MEGLARVSRHRTVPPEFFRGRLVDERFNFYGKGLEVELRSCARDWQRGMDSTSAALGEAVGKMYVERYFPAATKASAQAMVADLVQAFAKRIDAPRLDVTHIRAPKRNRSWTL